MKSQELKPNRDEAVGEKVSSPLSINFTFYFFFILRVCVCIIMVHFKTTKRSNHCFEMLVSKCVI